MTTADESMNVSPGALAAFRSVWNHQRWRWLLGSSVVSLAGDFLYWVAIAVYFSGYDNATLWISASLLARLLPYVLVSPFGGAIADQFDRRSLLIWLDAARAGLFLIMAGVVAADASPAFVICLLVFIASATAIYGAASVAAIPLLVPESDIAAANAGEEGLAQLSWFVGPALGAILVTVLDPSIVLVINAATFVVSAAMISRIGHVGGATETSGNSGVTVASLLADVKDGGRLIFRNRGLGGLTLMATAVSFAYGAEQLLYVLVASERLDLGAEGIGYLMAAMGVGGLLATPIAARVGNSPKAGVWLIGSAVLVTLPLVLISFTDSAPIVLGFAAVEGAAAIVFGVLAITLLQRTVDESMMARAYSVYDAVGALGQSLGSVGAPIVVALAGLTVALQVAGGISVVVMFVLTPAVLALARQTDQSRRQHAATANWLGKIPELASFELVELERLARSSTDRHVDEGEVVITEGDAPDKLYVVRSGRFGVITSSPLVAGVAPPDLGPNDLFGEIGLLRNVVRTATVTALTDADLLEINGSAFVAIATPNSAATAPLLGGMRSRLQHTHPDMSAGDEPPGHDVEQVGAGT